MPGHWLRWTVSVIALCLLGEGALAQTRQEGVIAPDSMTPELGFCYTARVQTPSVPDCNAAARGSVLRLFEEELELGPPHAMHQSIRDEGRGLFSHWWGSDLQQYQGEAQLYFSTSDNSDPRTNGRNYRWVILLDAAGKPIPADVGVLTTSPCRLRSVPDGPLPRTRHTTLLASFDSPDTNGAQFARTYGAEVGVGGLPDAPGKWDGGVAVESPGGAVRFGGLDNYSPRVGTAEFWAQSRAAEPIWGDGKEHWLLVLYPERAGAPPRDGMSPHFITLRKTSANELELRVVNQTVAHYAAGVSLRDGRGWALSVPAAALDASVWHHVLVSWDLRGRGRLWLTVDGEGRTAPLGLRPDAPAQNPGLAVLLGGLWGLPGDDVRVSECNLDDLRIEDCTVERRLEGAASAEDPAISQERLVQEMDLSRAMLDRLMELQFHGGLGAGYNWPTYDNSGWSLVGRGVDMWFSHSAFAGQALLRGWLIWGDDRYLDAAIEAADMFC